MQRFGQYLIYAIIVFSSLAAVNPSSGFYNALDTPRRLIASLGAGLLLACILHAWALRRRFVLRWHRLDACVLLYVAAAVVGSIGGIAWRLSFFGPLWTQDSLLLLGLVVIVYFGIKEFIRTPKEFEFIVLLLVLTAVASALVGLWDRFLIGESYQALLRQITALTASIQNMQAHQQDVSTLQAQLAELTQQKEALGRMSMNANFLGSRLVATMGNSMFTGTYFAIMIPLAVGGALQATRPVTRAIFWSSAGLFLPVLLLTLARAAWIGFIVGAVVVAVMALRLWVRNSASGRGSVAALVVVGGLIVTVLLATLIPQVNTRLRSIVNMESGTVKTRQVYMQAAINIYKAYPIQGVGYGNLRLIFPQFRPRSMAIESKLPLNRGFSTALPHNLFLQIMAETGTLGIAAFLLLLGVAFWAGGRMLRGHMSWLAVGLLGALTAYLVTNLFAFDNTATLLLFWMILGLMAASQATDQTLPSRYGALAKPLAPVGGVRAQRGLAGGGHGHGAALRHPDVGRHVVPARHRVRHQGERANGAVCQSHDTHGPQGDQKCVAVV